MRPGHGEGARGGVANGCEEDGNLQPALAEIDGVEGLYRCATMRQCYARDLLDGGRTTTMNLASD